MRVSLLIILVLFGSRSFAQTVSSRQVEISRATILLIQELTQAGVVSVGANPVEISVVKSEGHGAGLSLSLSAKDGSDGQTSNVICNMFYDSNGQPDAKSASCN